MSDCKCEGCQRKRFMLGGYQPCLEPGKTAPPPTVEFVGRPDPDRATPFELIPLCIFALSIGMAIGKNVL